MEKRTNMAKKKKSQVELEYSKQRRRIQSFIRKHEKEGFHFEVNILPAIPKKITKSSVSRLKKLTAEKLYSKAVYASEETYGEVVSAYKGKQLRKQKAKRKRERKRKLKSQHARTPKLTTRYKLMTDQGFYTRTVLSGWYGLLEEYSNGKAYHTLRMWMNKLIRDNGEARVCRALEKAASEGALLVWDVAYKIPLAIEYMGNVMKYLFDSPLERAYYTDEMDDLINFWLQIGRDLEEDEDWERPF